MKKWFIIVAVCSIFHIAEAQAPLYDENANAMQQITEAVARASQEHKYVLCQVGGNWCPWCIRFARFVQADTAISSIMANNYVYIHVNYSKANKNEQAMRYLGNPARFGFPVLVVLDEEGKVLHIQNSAYLEEGNSYSADKVKDCLQQWTPQAVHNLK